jgi:Fe-S-cluster containining protein
MKRFPKITLDARNKKIIFHGDCNEARDLCEAICCRVYDVTVTGEEFRSGRYHTREICSVTGKQCEKPDISCMNRRYFLRKKEDGSCVYLDEESKCSIHPERPKSCRDFHCREGWQISYAYMAGDEETGKRLLEETDRFVMETLKDDMKFIRNPAVKLKTLFYSKEKNQVHVVKELVEKCGMVSDKHILDVKGLSDGDMLCLAEIFNGEHDLGEVRRKFKERSGLDIPVPDFYKIIWMLFCQKIIVFKCETDMFGRERCG